MEEAERKNRDGSLWKTGKGGGFRKGKGRSVILIEIKERVVTNPPQEVISMDPERQADRIRKRIMKELYDVRRKIRGLEKHPVEDERPSRKKKRRDSGVG